MNQDTSEMMPLNLSEITRKKLSALIQARWKLRGIRYLGIKFLMVLEDMINDNVRKLSRRYGPSYKIVGLEGWQLLK